MAPDARASELAVNLIAVLVATDEERPRVLTVGGDALPSGPFALGHRSLQAGMRDWVERQTHQPIGYVEQLYTFADRDRGGEAADDEAARMVSISYLGLTREGLAREGVASEAPDGGPWRRSLWVDWYAFFPWEDRRSGTGPADAALQAMLEAALLGWAEAAEAPLRQARRERCAINFGLDGHGWNEELVLQRYELLFEARLIPEARPPCATQGGDAPAGLVPGRRMTGDHRRILATGLARLRAKLKYRPVVFELLAPSFTLTQLQRSVEALAGRLLHKQNFRRLIEQQNLVEETGGAAIATGGRPAKLYRYRRDILAERENAGTKLPLAGVR